MNSDIKELFYALSKATKEVERIRTLIKYEQDTCSHSWSERNLEHGTKTCMECLVSTEAEL